ncbi:MAG TPA: hypothetical protein VN903_22895 [Polyangia bacterium]|jgi:general secretion pathway protein C|nr:hypothetical protein [Polyangia bacterium]
MELLRRYVWVVDLIGILVGAGIAGHATATFIGDALPSQVEPPARRRPVSAPLPLDLTDVPIKPIGVHYEISRRFLDELLKGGTIPALPRIVPATRNGETVGVHLFGIHRYSSLAELGLASGDILLAVNGFLLKDPDTALAAYSTLRNANHASLLIERGGRPIRLEYTIR